MSLFGFASRTELKMVIADGTSAAGVARGEGNDELAEFFENRVTEAGRDLEGRRQADRNRRRK